MQNALQDAKIAYDSIDYVNAHAPSTPIGDASEMKALKSIFPESTSVMVSSTKALTGHGLSLSSIMEAAFCCLALKMHLCQVLLILLILTQRSGTLDYFEKLLISR